VQARAAKVVDALGTMDFGHCLGGLRFYRSFGTASSAFIRG
jgi:hypothetical protein